MQYTPKAFIAGALSTASGLVRLETLYEQLGALCTRKQFETFIPHRDASIKNIPDMTPQRMYRINMEKLAETDLLIAYVGQPSTGVGMEIQQASSQDTDIVILSEIGKPVSTFLKGCPKVLRHILFKDFNDGIAQLEIFIDEWLLTRNRFIPENSTATELVDIEISADTLLQQPASIIN